MKKLCSMVLVIALIISLSSINIMAEDTGALAGSGTADDPYLISSSGDFLKIWSECGGYTTGTQGPFASGKYFKQTSDFAITTTMINNAVGSNKKNRFAGIYDGNGHNVTYTGENSVNAPLFGSIKGGTVKNANVDGSITSSADTIAVFAWAIENGTIINSSCSVDMHYLKQAAYNYSPYAYSADSSSYFTNCIYNGSITYGINKDEPDPYLVEYGYPSPILHFGYLTNVSDCYFNSDKQQYVRVRTVLRDANGNIKGTEAKSTDSLNANLLNKYIMKNNRTDLNLWADTENGPKVSGDDLASLWSGNGTEESPYLISTAADFLKIHNATEGTTYEGKYFKQTKDFLLSLNILHDNAKIKKFAGIYDGNGCKITLINKNRVAPALFANLAGMVKNLNVDGSVTVYTKGADYGMIAKGFMSPALIENCNISADVTDEAPDTNSLGVYAAYYSGTGEPEIKNCAFTGTIKAPNVKSSSGGVRLSPFICWGHITKITECYYAKDNSMIIRDDQNGSCKNGEAVANTELLAKMNINATNLWVAEGVESLPSVSRYAKNVPQIDSGLTKSVIRETVSGYTNTDNNEKNELYKYVKTTEEFSNIVSYANNVGIVGCYNEGCLETVNTFTMGKDNSLQKVVYDKNYDETRVFLWDENMKPIVESKRDIR